VGRTARRATINVLALGRRAANLGVRWLRTADLVILCARAGKLDDDRAVAAPKALHSAGRMTESLLQACREELA
jgi:hypothetical protein